MLANDLKSAPIQIWVLESPKEWKSIVLSDIYSSFIMVRKAPISSKQFSLHIKQSLSGGVYFGHQKAKSLEASLYSIVEF